MKIEYNYITCNTCIPSIEKNGVLCFVLLVIEHEIHINIHTRNIFLF